MLIKDVRGNGNCFLRAFYNAASEAGLLARACKGLSPGPCPVPVSAGRSPAPCCGLGEDEFVKCARQSVARRVKTESGGSDHARMYAYISGVDDAETRDEILSSQPDWLVRALGSSKDQTAFVRRCVCRIMMEGTWFGQLEVSTFARMMAACKISVIVKSTDGGIPESEIAKLSIPADSVVLINFDELHYNFLSAGAAGGAGRKARAGNKSSAAKKKAPAVAKKQPPAVVKKNATVVVKKQTPAVAKKQPPAVAKKKATVVVKKKAPSRI